MRLVMMLVAGDKADVLSAQLGFHLAVGVDAILVPDRDYPDDVDTVVQAYETAGGVERVTNWASASDGQRARGLAAGEHGADWLIQARDGEFWLPRASSFRDVLLPTPPRYGIVQALTRTLVSEVDDGRPWWERTTIRRALRETVGEPRRRGEILRGVWRCGSGSAGNDQPLRAWYPIEVLSLETDRRPEDGHATREGLESGSLVSDSRLRDAIRRLCVDGELPLPATPTDVPILTPPTVVDDALYAVDCAEVGEVDPEVLEQRIQLLERRIIELEARLWPRIQRVGRRLVTRGGP